MASVCANCGKTTVFGRSQQHGRGVAGKRWKNRAQSTKRVFKANIQAATIIRGGKEVRLALCAKCIKRFKKDGLMKSQQISLTPASL